MKFTSVSSSSLKAGVNEEEEVGAAWEEGLEEVDGALETLLIEFVFFSRGRPCLSKKLSAISATSAALIPSTSLPMISLNLGGMLLRRCSFLIWSIVTSLVSSTSCFKY